MIDFSGLKFGVILYPLFRIQNLLPSLITLFNDQRTQCKIFVSIPQREFFELTRKEKAKRFNNGKLGVIVLILLYLNLKDLQLNDPFQDNLTLKSEQIVVNTGINVPKRYLSGVLGHHSHKHCQILPNHDTHLILTSRCPCFTVHSLHFPTHYLNHLDV